MTSQAIGAWGEACAQRYLQARGLTLLERNWRSKSPRGELDLIMEDPSGVCVFVEVKTRRGDWPIEEAVNGEKLHRLRLLSLAWLRERHRRGGYRIDIVGVRERSGKIKVSWWQGVDR